MNKQLTIFDELNYEIPASPSVAFVDEVEIFNATFGKPNTRKKGVEVRIRLYP